MVQLVTRQAGIAAIKRILQEVRLALLTTQSPNGELHSRPLISHDAEFAGDLWFFMEHDSAHVCEIARTPRVNVGYLNHNCYISLAGVARLVEDAARKRELWREALRAWFAAGPDSPDLALIKVEVESGQWWENPYGGKLASVPRLFTMRDVPSPDGTAV